MNSIKIIEKISKKYSVSTEEFILSGSILCLEEKKRQYNLDRLEYFSRYGVSLIKELEVKIKDGLVPEHPAWEDLIEIENIESEVKEIENDIKSLQAIYKYSSKGVL